jgi:hypothetical protein
MIVPVFEVARRAARGCGRRQVRRAAEKIEFVSRLTASRARSVVEYHHHAVQTCTHRPRQMVLTLETGISESAAGELDGAATEHLAGVGG